ncbi:MAG TPA: hypothetical protein DCZ94_01325 [Lentisphaeria bacterium]|nr:MAG: hypothetical protein A2X48_11455 [Lentisphaerae bacterium GWF2_49_21]HBC85572.1 hypothetical protein [Lentisphaeria bacterium]
MTDAHFMRLVLEVEKYAAGHPRRYKLKTILLVIFGFAMPMAIVLLIACGMVALPFIMLKLDCGANSDGMILLLLLSEFALGCITFIVFKSAWGGLGNPGGYELSPAEAPRLFELVEEISRKMVTAKISSIRLNADMNAAVLQRPRFAIPFFFRNHLLLGLPLLNALPKAEMEALLAHEFAHISGSHGIFSAWIYRTRKTWQELYSVGAMDKRRLDLFWHILMRWYVPFCAAYTYVLGRSWELEADSRAARMAGNEKMASCLIDIELKTKVSAHDFWPAIYDRVVDEEIPPKDVFMMLNSFHKSESKFQGTEVLLGHLLKARTGINDSHPCLGDRLAAIGQDMKNPEVRRNLVAGFMRSLPLESAAEFYLEKRNSHYTSIFSKNWKASIIGYWRQRHGAAEAAKKRIAELLRKMEKETLSKFEDTELFKCRLTVSGSPDSRLALARKQLELHPESAEAHYFLGVELLSRDDDSGIDELGKAMQMHSDYALCSFEEIQGYLLKNGRDDDLAPYREKVKAFCDEAKKADAERQKLSRRDSFIPHDLPPEKVTKICDVISHLRRITRAYLVRKQVSHLADRPCYVLALELRKNIFEDELNNDFLQKELTRCLSYLAPVTVVLLPRWSWSMGKRFSKIRESLVYSRNSPVSQDARELSA